MGSLPWQLVVGPADITGIQAAHHGVSGATVAGVTGYTDALPLAVHMIEQAAQVFSRDIGFQGPGDVGVPENHAGVGYALHHYVLVDHLVPQRDRMTIHHQVHATQHLDIQPSRRNDDVGLQFLAGFQQNTVLGKAFDMVRLHRRLARLDRLKQITVLHHTQALIPGVVAG